MDLWALGLVIYEMIVGKSPFKYAGNFAVYEAILKCKYDLPEDMPAEAKDIIQVMAFNITLIKYRDY